MLIHVCYDYIFVFRSGGTGGSAASSPALLRDSPQYKPAGNASLLLAASTTPPSVSGLQQYLLSPNIIQYVLGYNRSIYILLSYVFREKLF